MDQDIGYLHLDESGKNVKDTYSFSRLSKTTFTVESTAILKLPPLRTGQWKYQKLYKKINLSSSYGIKRRYH